MLEATPGVSPMPPQTGTTNARGEPAGSPRPQSITRGIRKGECPPFHVVDQAESTQAKRTRRNSRYARTPARNLLEAGTPPQDPSFLSPQRQEAAPEGS